MGIFINTKRTKEGDKIIGIIWLGYFLLIVILTYTIPANILDAIPLFRTFVKILADVFPSVGYFDKYSEFPQVSQLIYSFGIISLPIHTIILFHYNDLELDIYKSLERPFLFLLIAPSALIGAFICPLFFLPGQPDYRSGLSAFVSEFYHVKLIFSFGTALFFLGSSASLFAIIGYLKGIPNIFK
jgi:hypothetical protein